NSSVYNRCSCGTTYGCQRICRDCCGNIRVNNNCGCGCSHGCYQWLWDLLFGNTCAYVAQTRNTCGYTAQTTNGYGCGYTAQTATTGCRCGYNG
ncbi:MAG: hypothetical protein IKB20_05145, partial [Clostridia bacterium]|nr:hypothetical protein [Clostridia bacterium]